MPDTKTDPTIEAGARALWDSCVTHAQSLGDHFPAWDDVDEDEHNDCRETVRTVLDAAGPLLRARWATELEAHAESIGWYEGGGVWAEAIELAKGEHVSQKPATDPWPEAPLTTAQEPDQQPDDPAARYCQCGAALVNGLCPDTAEGRKDQAAGPGSATTTPQES